ncbi:thermonuclease family protein [Oharaeibacter diazotrophicus]|uniref:Nuclease-like protein n=1 Tax=Oharaeibacter diazotrophicus TaxID=1920512 RepID=A0A4R6RG20_9HYPH|nr:thermonuclease family protein [Oharaeibacter diazotrophicus]TDP85361.1 nuclease-like protein [Oharaeibacter diazotrophicus]BBE74331.1 hypothetical protein OHA_1_03962 [Pleomorphomonas sp. SM30]GLS75978.1 hypothetical protein GCM10007904_13130 [Oharaeibacter diazotrophicus]
MNLLPILLFAAGVATAITSTPGETLRIVDGDTVALGRERIRLESIDAPERSRPHCRAEAEAATAASERLAELLDVETVTIARHGRDRYGRTLATLTTPSGDVGAVLVAEGLALPWRPGKAAHDERTAHWCGPGNTSSP